MPIDIASMGIMYTRRWCGWIWRELTMLSTGTVYQADHLGITSR